MQFALVCTPSSSSTAGWVSDQLTARGHAVDQSLPLVPDARSAGAVGHSLADRWATELPDMVLALGWEAGLAAHVGSRSTRVPIVLRLTRAARSPGSERDRLETALARGSRRVLLPSAGELDHLVDRGVGRSTLRVLPDAVDRTRFVDAGGELPPVGVHRIAVAGPAATAGTGGVLELLRGLPAYEPVVLPGPARSDDELAAALRSVHALVLTDDGDAEVSLALRAMSCAVPVVAVATGTLADLVADEVTGLLVPRAAGAAEALRSLLVDPLRRQSMGLAAVDRVRARFDTAVVGAALEGLLLDVAPDRVAAASWAARSSRAAGAPTLVRTPWTKAP